MKIGIGIGIANPGNNAFNILFYMRRQVRLCQSGGMAHCLRTIDINFLVIEALALSVSRLAFHLLPDLLS